MRLKYLLTCFILVLVLQSCIMLPEPEHGLHDGRGMIKPEDTKTLQIGVTTREAILLQFGEPDATLNQQTVFVYGWTTIVGEIYVFIFNERYYMELRTLLMIEFDSQNLLKRFEYIYTDSEEGSTMKSAIKWVSKEKP